MTTPKSNQSKSTQTTKGKQRASIASAFVPKGKALVQGIVQAAFNKKATNVKVLDLRQVTSMADYFVLCTGESGVQLRAIRDAIKYEAKNMGEKPWHVEDSNDPRWVLMDFVDVVVHLFTPEARLFYDLEHLWGDAKTITCNENDYLKRPSAKSGKV